MLKIMVHIPLRLNVFYFAQLRCFPLMCAHINNTDDIRKKRCGQIMIPL